jgi:hypothetical protein
MIMLVLATVGCPPLNHDGAAIDENRPGRVAGDHDGVVQRIANNPQYRPCGGKSGGDRRQHALVERLDLRQEPAVIDLLADRPGFLQQAMQTGPFHEKPPEKTGHNCPTSRL